jgi:hypothetical protein
MLGGVRARLAARGRFDSTDSITRDRIQIRPANDDAGPLPPILLTWLAPLRDCFMAPVWRRALVLVAGAVLAPGQRTVGAALRVMGLAGQPSFGRFHEVLSEARRDSHALARRLLLRLLDALLLTGEVVNR